MSHKAILTTVANIEKYEFVGADAAKVAYQARCNLLRVNGIKYNADPETLTVDWVDQLGVHVTITYQESGHPDSVNLTLAGYEHAAQIVEGKVLA